MVARAHLFKIDGRVLGGMQFGVLVQVLFWGVTLRAHLCRRNAVWGAGPDGAVGRSSWGFEVLVTARAYLCDIDARVLSGMQVTVQAHVCIARGHAA